MNQHLDWTPRQHFLSGKLSRDINKDGVTVILTTHAMTEAEALSDRVAIIDHGKIAALDTPENLKNMLSNSDTTIFSMKIMNLTSEIIESIKSLDIVTAIAQQDDHNIKISAKGTDALNQIIDTIRREGGDIFSIVNSNESTLEDVFLTVTGKEMRDQASEKAPPISTWTWTSAQGKGKVMTMDIMKILKDSYHIMAKDLLALKRNRMSLAALFIMPIAFLGHVWIYFPKR